MSKFILLLLLAQSPTVELTIELDSQRVGTAYITAKPTDAGGKKSQAKLVLVNGSQRSTFIDEAEYDAEGRPIRRYIRRIGPDGQEMRIATFSKTGVSVVSELNGKRETTKVPLPSGSVLAKSELWFIKTNPPQGETCTYQRFDMDRLAWVETVVKYEGQRTLKSGEDSIKAHLVTVMGTTRSWLDSHGRPIRVEAGKLTFTRQTK